MCIIPKETKADEKFRKDLSVTMLNSIRPVAPIIPNTEKEKQDSELWNAIGTAIHMCGYTGEDVTAMSLEVMKRLGRYDLLPPCERRNEP